MSLLEVGELRVVDADGHVVVERLSLEVRPGSVVALVGEPGAGAVEAGLAILDASDDVTVTGELRVGDDELLVLGERKRRQVRGARIGALYPDPREAFDPGLTLFENLQEVVVYGAGLPRQRSREVLIAELENAGVPTPSISLYRRAGELPRGILQRACVALAAACESHVVVAESPAATLDVLDRAEVHELLRRLADERDVGVLLITEDIVDAAVVADRIVLMYAGEVHEAGPADALLERPRGPYTRALLASTPRLDVPVGEHQSLGGRMPAEPETIRGCRFADRCAFVERLCRGQHPDLREVGALATRCHFADETTWLERLDVQYGWRD